MLPATGRQHRGCIIPQAVTHSLVLMKMGKIIARNMLSWLIINKPLLLHLVGCLYYLYQWCTVKQISDNEIYLLIKYIKSVLWRVAKRLSLCRGSAVPKDQKFPPLFLHHCGQHSLPTEIIYCITYPVHTYISFGFRIHFNIILPTKKLGIPIGQPNFSATNVCISHRLRYCVCFLQEPLVLTLVLLDKGQLVSQDVHYYME